MLLTAISIENSRGEILSIPMEATPGGFFVREVLGLGPVKAQLVSAPFANMDGENYQSSRLEKRNIVAKLGLDPDYTQGSAYDLRAALYHHMMPKDQVVVYLTMVDRFNLNIVDSELKVKITARVESMEPAMFTREPTLDISMLCYKPEFLGLSTKTIFGSTESGLVETPFEYPGTTPTPGVFRLVSDRLIDDLAIYHRTPDNSLRAMYVNTTIVDDDTVVIDSTPGSKSATLKSLGVTRSILDSVVGGDWLLLMPGTNHLRVYAFGDPVPYTIEYVEKYGGL